MAYTYEQVARLKRVHDRFYAYTAGNYTYAALQYSPDGVSWDGMNNADFNGISLSNFYCLDMAGDSSNQMVVFKHYESSEIQLFFSEDNRTFTRNGIHPYRPNFLNINKLYNSYSVNVDNSLFLTVNGETLIPYKFYDSVQFGESSFIAYSDVEGYVRLEFGIGKYVSTNGVDWTYDTPIPYEPIRIYFFNQKFIIHYVDNNDGLFYIASSQDGINFDTNVQIQQVYDVAYNASLGMYMAVGEYTTTNKTFLTSTDLINWNIVNTTDLYGFTSPYSARVLDNAYLITYNNQLFRSTDLVNWSLSLDFTGYYNGYNSDVIVAISNDVVNYSTDVGLTWTPTDITQSIQYIFMAGETIVLIDSLNNIMTTVDGVTYTNNPLPKSDQLTENVISIYPYGGAVSSEGTIAFTYTINEVRYLLKSNDNGLTWNYTPEQLNLPPLNSNTVLWDRYNRIVNSSDINFDKIFYTEDEGNTWVYWNNPMVVESVPFNSTSWKIVRVPQYGYTYIINVLENNITAYQLADGEEVWERIGNTSANTQGLVNLNFDWNGSVFIIKYAAWDAVENRQLDYIYTTSDFSGRSWSSRWVASQDDSITWSSGLTTNQPTGIIIGGTSQNTLYPVLQIATDTRATNTVMLIGYDSRS